MPLEDSIQFETLAK